MKKYGNDYKLREEGYEYTKEWYKPGLTKEELKKRAVLWMGESAVLTLLFVLGLSLNNTGSRVFTVLMPYVCAVFPVAYFWRGSLSLYSFCRKQSGKNPERTDGGKLASKVLVPEEHKGHMVRAEFEQSIRRNVRSAGLLTFLSLFSFLADLVLIFTGEEILLAREILFAADALLMLALGFLLMLQTRKLRASFVKAD